MRALADGAPGRRLCFVTAGAESVTPDQPPVRPTQAVIAAICKVARLEHPELRCLHIDLEPGMDAESSRDAVLAELASGREEPLVAIRSGARFVPRLRRTAARAKTPFRVTAGAAGLEGIEVRPHDPAEPASNEVQIQVRAAALNFRDLANVLGMRNDAAPIGSECAGVVLRAGASFAPGDEVVAIAPACFASHAVANAQLVFRKPKNLGFEQAAGSLLAFLTAGYALHDVGQLKAGERVLIHAAAGGVGLAAVQYALLAGAEVFATAGSEEKRAYLRSLGIRTVLDSRSLAFADRLHSGIDLVLNSLAGEFIPAGLKALATGGRFLEIGKADTWDAERAHSIRPDVAYHRLDLAGPLEHNPASLRAALQQILDDLESGRLAPLPLRVFPIAETRAAFRFMMQARHIGKIVLANAPEACVVRSDGAYLVTGGLSGLGLLVAEWLARKGAGSIVLMGRREPDETSAARIERLRASGTPVHVSTGDVAFPPHVEAALARPEHTLRGIFHCAGVLDDGALAQLTAERFERVLRPKIAGAWNLHLLTRGLPLDHFVLFSSAASLLGSRGQASHAAANAYLDAFAHYRRACGLSALSVNWGPWSGTGAAVRTGAAARAARTITPEAGIDALERLLAGGAVQAGVIPAAPGELTGSVPARQKPETFSLESLAGYPARKRKRELLSELQKMAAAVLGLTGAGLATPDRPMAELGLDSLMAIEFRNRLATAFRRPFPGQRPL